MKRILSYVLLLSFIQVNAQSDDLPDRDLKSDTSLINSIFYNPQENIYNPILYAVNGGADQYSLEYISNDYNWNSKLFSMNYDQLKFSKDTLPFFEGRYDYGSDFTHWFGVDFSRNVGESKLILNFNRNKSEDLFSNTAVERSNFVLGTKIKLSKRYTVDFGYYRNEVDKSESGGIKDIENYKKVDDLTISSVDPLLSTANNSVFNNGFILNQSFNLQTKRDSVWGKLSELNLKLNTKIEENRFVFSLNETDIDSGYFSNTFIDSTGTFDSIGFQKLVINPELNWIKMDSSKGFSFGYQKEFYDFSNLDRSSINFNSFFKSRNIKYSLSGLYSLESIWQGNYCTDFKLEFDSIHNSIFTFTLKSKANSPEYLFHTFSGNHYEWNNNLDAVNEQSVILNWYKSKYKLNIKGEVSQIDNYIYFDNNTSVQQHNTSIRIAKINLHHHFNYKWLKITSSFNGQVSNSDLIRIPEFYSRNTFSFNVKARNVPMSMGLIMTYVSEFKGMLYNPAIRHYVIGNETVGDLALIDLFYVARVGTADLYVRYENLLFNTLNRDMFIGDNSPLSKSFLRFGLNWKLFN